MLSFSRLARGKASNRFHGVGGGARGRTFFALPLGVLVGTGIALATLGAFTLRLDRNVQIEAYSNGVRLSQARARSLEQYVVRTLAASEMVALYAAHLADHHDGLMPRHAPDPLLADPFYTAVISSTVQGRDQFGGNSAVPDKLFERFAETAAGSSRDLIVAPPVEVGDAGLQVPVIRVLDRQRGYFAATLLSPDRFTDLADKVAFRETDLISVIGLDGVTRGRRTGALRSAGERVGGLVMERQFANPNGTYLGPSVLDGIPRFFSHARLSRYELFVTSGVAAAPLDERVAAQRATHHRVLGITTIPIVAAALILLLWIRRHQQQLDELLASNQRLNEAQQIGLIGDWDYFAEGDRLVWSENLSRMYQRPHSAVTTSLSEINKYIDPADTEDAIRQIHKVIANTEPSTWELRATIGGEQSFRRIRAAPIVNDNGAVIGVHGTDQDITGEVNIRALEERLTDLARLDSMSAMASTLAHELNQPLGITSNFLAAASRLLNGKHPADPRIRDYLSASRGQITHMSEIIAAARALVSGSGVRASTGNVQTMIEEVRAMIQTATGRSDISLVATIEGGSEQVRGNLPQLKLVLFNLARNGVEAVPNERRPKLSVSVHRDEDGAQRFAVSDNGAGLQDIVDPFAALVSSKASGLGLGLSLSRTIVEAHGGRIWVESSGGQGTTIVFTVNDVH